MATPSGLGGQFGYASETSPGLPVTVTEFLPFNGSPLGQEIERLDSQGIRAGRLVTAAWKSGQRTISGEVEMELWNADIASLFRHMFGAVSTTGSDPYTHTFTPTDLTGESMTVQIGRPATSTTVHSFTYSGCKVASWSLSAEVGSICMLSLDIVGMTETTGIGLASASYDSGLAPFCFTTASVTIGGSPVGTVKSFELNGDNALTERFRLGSATSKEYLNNGFREYSGEIVTDFEDLTAYNRFVNGTEAALVLEFDNGTDSLTITSNVRFDGQTPESGLELLEQSLPFKCVSVTNDLSAITAVFINGDQFATN